MGGSIHGDVQEFLRRSFDRGARTEQPFRLLPDFLTRIAGGVRTYLTRAEAERRLEELDDRLLLDIGLKRSEIRHMVWGAGRRG